MMYIGYIGYIVVLLVYWPTVLVSLLLTIPFMLITQDENIKEWYQVFLKEVPKSLEFSYFKRNLWK